MRCFLNEKNLLTADRVVFFAHTSGSTGASKMIPCTQSTLDILMSTFVKRVFGIYDLSCREGGSTGMPDCKGIALMETRIGYTPYGVAHGAISETWNLRNESDAYNALPEELIYPLSDFDRRYMKMLFALREHRLSFMLCTFAPFIYDMLVYLRDHWEMLSLDVENGSINPDVAVDPRLRRKLEARMSPDPERAAQIREIMVAHGDEAFVPLLWPDMKLVATIGTATFAPYIEKLRQFLGEDVAVDYLGYGCSEATIAVALQEDAPEYMLLPWSGFYEFIPMEEGASDTPLLMDQLEVGKEYEVIVTNLSGFYRYRLGDVVKVVGYHNECPMLVFSYRKSQLVSMYGEKVTETALRTAVEGMVAESGVPVLEYSVYADAGTDPGHYVMLLESDREIKPDEWPGFPGSSTASCARFTSPITRRSSRRSCCPWRSNSSSPRPSPCIAT